jgi:hypothetical protein
MTVTICIFTALMLLGIRMCVIAVISVRNVSPVMLNAAYYPSISTPLGGILTMEITPDVSLRIALHVTERKIACHVTR